MCHCAPSAFAGSPYLTLEDEHTTYAYSVYKIYTWEIVDLQVLCPQNIEKRRDAGILACVWGFCCTFISFWYPFVAPVLILYWLYKNAPFCHCFIYRYALGFFCFCFFGNHNKEVATFNPCSIPTSPICTGREGKETHIWTSVLLRLPLFTNRVVSNFGQICLLFSLLWPSAYCLAWGSKEALHANNTQTWSWPKTFCRDKMSYSHSSWTTIAWSSSNSGRATHG